LYQTFIEHLKQANPKPLLDWLNARWSDLKDIANTEISFKDLDIESQISQYAKLTAHIRAEPSLRKKIPILNLTKTIKD